MPTGPTPSLRSTRPRKTNLTGWCYSTLPAPEAAAEQFPQCPQCGGGARRAAVRTGHWPLSTLPPSGQRQRLETQPPPVNKLLHSRCPPSIHVCSSRFEGGVWEPRLGWEGPEHWALYRDPGLQLHRLPCPSNSRPGLVSCRRHSHVTQAQLASREMKAKRSHSY